MITGCSRAATLALTVSMFAGASRFGHAAYEELKEPSVARTPDYHEADYKEIVAVLKRPDCKFLGGSALNAHTALRYGSDTIGLNKFIEALSQCPHVRVHVKFYRPSPGQPECDWTVTHMPRPKMDFVVRINLESKHIKLEDLYLPPVKAEKEETKRSE